eukprot:CAMPEP_0114254106 /NCGR_PEP_ID=MMETSP0058-20121206/16788_1 /TAXON_ID=36894 /ORGANISM="Pyramimonas parkeae, CCMP726" /LENGTH=286 /DNA_ID=CAMNT_0001368275 /DNA_START=60 /DNA_END=920 /DNA_ORIENTATION=-
MPALFLAQPAIRASPKVTNDRACRSFCRYSSPATVSKAFHHTISWRNGVRSTRGTLLYPGIKRVAAREVQPGRRVASSPTALFTGIVQGLSEVKKMEKKPDDFMTLTMRFPSGAVDGVQIGASIAINGTCLTVTKQEGDECCFDLIKETLRATNLGDLDIGSVANFERSARMGDEIGGHQVSGHVDCKAVVTKVEDSENNRRLVFTVPEEWMKYILPKGFIAIDGCSLTIGEVSGNTFSVYLIPETLRVTVFGTKAEGDSVNIEVERQTQAIVNTVERYLAERNML